MQSVSLTLSKRLSNSKPLWRISSNLVAYSSTSASSPPPPSQPISAAANGTTSPPSTLNHFLTAPWSATQTRGITLSGSDVRVGNLNRGRVYEVLKLYHPREGTEKAAIKVPPHTVAGYATAATTEDGIIRLVGAM
ncbi:hypothetical protein SESBI_40206 [Sesbania bispinosa]|nr:hypothetical protein SESBI_40206 [Sesbania bispinosa]